MDARKIPRVIEAELVSRNGKRYRERVEIWQDGTVSRSINGVVVSCTKPKYKGDKQ